MALGWGGALAFKDALAVVSMLGGGVNSSGGTPESVGILDSGGSCALFIFQPIQLEQNPAKQPTKATASVITATCAAASASSEASLDSCKTLRSSALASEVTASASSAFSTTSSASSSKELRPKCLPRVALLGTSRDADGSSAARKSPRRGRRGPWLTSVNADITWELLARKPGLWP